jgi:hypothetical protein
MLTGKKLEAALNVLASQNVSVDLLSQVIHAGMKCQGSHITHPLDFDNNPATMI